jgi:predicted nucleic acid-binding protein
VATLPLAEPHLVDTSAWSRAGNTPELARLFDDSVRRGMVATCDLVAVELLCSAQNNDRFIRQLAMLASLRQCPTTGHRDSPSQTGADRPAATGHQRGVKPADLLIAAAAEAAGLPILHHDHDYELVAAVTGQRACRLAEPGSLV